MKDVKEKPILFSTPMVNAVLDGSKTQTREQKEFALDAWDYCVAIFNWKICFILKIKPPKESISENKR